MKGYIYKYTFPNGKVYIGQTGVSVMERHYQHKSASKDASRRTICETDIAKYGDPVLETIEEIEVKSDDTKLLNKKLKEAKEKWIKEYDSANVRNGYNILNGGEKISEEEYILQEKWYEIFDKDWAKGITYVKEILSSVGTKLIITHEKLTKEENRIWFGYKFNEYNWGHPERETTFSSFYKRNNNNPILCDFGEIDYEDICKSTEDEEKRQQLVDRAYFDIIINDAINTHWIEDIRQTIWKQIMKDKEKIITEYYSF